jgi:hypothetical protein
VVRLRLEYATDVEGTAGRCFSRFCSLPSAPKTDPLHISTRSATRAMRSPKMRCVEWTGSRRKAHRQTSSSWASRSTVAASLTQATYRHTPRSTRRWAGKTTPPRLFGVTVRKPQPTRHVLPGSVALRASSSGRSARTFGTHRVCPRSPRSSAFRSPRRWPRYAASRPLPSHNRPRYPFLGLCSTQPFLPSVVSRSPSLYSLSLHILATSPARLLLCPLSSLALRSLASRALSISLSSPKRHTR